MLELSSSDPAGLLEGAGPGVRDPLGEAVGGDTSRTCPPAPQQHDALQMGLPAALLHSKIGEVPYKLCHMFFEAESGCWIKKSMFSPKQCRVSITKSSILCKCQFSKVSLGF